MIFKSGLQSRQSQLADAHGTCHRMPAELFDAVLVADQNAGLRSAQQFVTAKQHKICTGLETGGYVRFVELQRCKAGETAAAKIINQG